MSLLPDDTRLGPVSLTVADLSAQTAFYRDALGMRVLEEGGGRAVLGGAAPLVELISRPGAERPRRTTGLYHLALRLPDRPALGALAGRLAAHRHELVGASDHGVSEALYLTDPEGNGIELYRDRPATGWRRADGEIAFDNAPLDLGGLLADAAPADAAPADGSLDPGTVVGHVHLHVADLAAADDFYLDVLGFEKTSEFPGQAHFVSAGGYHHHVAYNVWHGRGAPPPPAGARGLRHFTLLLPADAAAGVVERASAARVPVEVTDGGTLLRDPSQNGVLIRSV